jgi:hypothetical protein
MSDGNQTQDVALAGCQEIKFDFVDGRLDFSS